MKEGVLKLSVSILVGTERGTTSEKGNYENLRVDQQRLSFYPLAQRKGTIFP